MKIKEMPINLLNNKIRLLLLNIIDNFLPKIPHKAKDK